MNFLNPTNVWQAQNLPDGLSFSNGVISGIPTTTGSFSVPVTVSNPLGSDSKNISILVKYRPGTQKFSILQDGTEVAKLTIPELQAMVQDGTAQSRFNCTNTQIVLPIVTPELKFLSYDESNNTLYHVFRPSSTEDVAMNFCSFRDVTLQDGSTRPGLVLQFSKTLWNQFAPFDTGDSADAKPFNRWKYSTLRQWLNSEGLNWFTPAYDGDALVTLQELLEHEYSDDLNNNERRDRALLQIVKKSAHSNYADDNIQGFLDLLPDDLHSILQPIKVVTQAFFDENNTNTSIDDPEDIDGYDADITYDKVFIPSLKEMFLGFTNPYWESVETMQAIAQEGVEGEPWEFFINKLSAVAYSTYTNKNYDWIKEHNGEWPYYIGGYTPFQDVQPFLDEWGEALVPEVSFEIYDYTYFQNSQTVLTRTAVDDSTYGIWSINYAEKGTAPFYYYDLNSEFDKDYANPAPAFVIC